ncbi:MAG: ABC transporter permease [Paludibacteraceae bacterium]|nr:ABC transporter permease [Paludibacteraceae bacterium]
MTLVWKLLRRHISIAQFAGFTLASLIGMSIVMIGMQFYTDTQAIYQADDSFMNGDYLIVSKRVADRNTFTGAKSSFSTDELDELKAQPFVESVGTFAPATFSVSAGVRMPSIGGLSTDMFFESVDDQFVDAMTADWSWQEGQQEIPIILPRDYLDLYNFGFAQSRNLPEVSEGIITTIQMDIRIRGNHKTAVYKGRIVGFSGRLNTILVPRSFMNWANEIYGAGNDVADVTRIIVKVNNPTDERITKFLTRHDYITNADKLESSKTGYVLKLVVSIVMSVGLLIMILSFYILMLCIYLLVQKNSQKLESLLLLGYSPALVARPYQLLTLSLNTLVFGLSTLILCIVRGLYIRRMADFFPQFDAPGMMTSIGFGLLLLLIISTANAWAVRHKMDQIWHHKS